MSKIVNRKTISASIIFVFLALFLQFDVYSEIPSEDNIKRHEILETAKKYIGVMYKYGGNKEGGFDCSGFVMFVYSQHDIQLPRSSSIQYKQSYKITKKQAHPGDLVFFTTYKRGASHVGIYMGGDDFIHSPSTGKRVSVAQLTNSYWRKRIVGFGTFFPKDIYKK